MTLDERTQFIAIATVPDGYFGERAVVGLCYDPHSLKTIAVHRRGTYIAPVPLAIDANEVLWLIKNHPDCKHIHI